MIRYFLLLFFVVVSTSLVAQGCLCTRLDSLQAFDSATLVFDGKVVKSETNWLSGGLKHTFMVERSWKQATDRLLIVNTPWQTYCGFPFEAGLRYRVFVRRKFTMKTDACNPNKQLGEIALNSDFMGTSYMPQATSNTSALIGAFIALGVLSLAFILFILFGKKTAQNLI